MNEVLHLMVNNTCNNNCPICCNKQYDVNKIPVVTVEELEEIEIICITGGEPFMSRNIIPFLGNLLQQFKNIEELYIYTSGMYLDRRLDALSNIGEWSGTNIGLSIGPKSYGDRENLRWYYIREAVKDLYHNRFYCFTDKDRELANECYNFSNTEIIDRKWQEKFVPAPNTIFRRLPVWI